MCVISDAVFVVLASLVLVLLAGTVRADGTGSPSLFGRTLFVVRSGSMEPALGTGDLLLADTSFDADSVDDGDVIVFRSGANRAVLISHRVERAWNTPDGTRWFATKGDANRTVDSGAITDDQIVGTMTGRVPAGGYALETVRNTGAIAVFGLGSLLAHAALLLARSADSDGIRRRRRGNTQQKGIIR